MKNNRTPNSDNSHQNADSADSIEVKPEVIVVEELENYEDPSQFNFEDLKKVNNSKHLIFVRVLCFIAAICCLLFALGVVAYTAFLLFLVMICLCAPSKSHGKI